MEAYRDQYAEIFNGGEGVTLLAISNDPPADMASWAADAGFPFLFGSDADGSAYAAFGGNPRDGGTVGSRAVIVVDPQGKIAKVIPQFMQVDPSAYTELAEAVDAAGGAMRD